MTHSGHVTSYLSVTEQTALAAPRLQCPMSDFETEAGVYIASALMIGRGIPGSRQPIPAGVSFENLQLREPFRSVQIVIFGFTQGIGEGCNWS
jgi:hypothetical protein